MPSEGKEEDFALLDQVQDFCLSQRLEDDFERFAIEHVAPFIDALREAKGDVPAVEHRQVLLRKSCVCQ
jgi:hypothetical protein